MTCAPEPPNEKPTFDEWRATGQDVADLRDHADVTQYYEQDYPNPVPGRIYQLGHMERWADGKFWFCVGNWDQSFDDLATAERVLWDEYASRELTR